MLFHIDFVINESRGCFFWLIKDIISLQFCHIHNVENKKYELHFKILHTPVRCNFWHFSIRVFSDNVEVDFLDIGRKIKKQLWRRAKTELREFAKIEVPNFGKLQSKYYS